MEAQISEFLDALEHDKGYARNTVEAYRNDLEQLVHFAHSERPTATLWDRVDKTLLLTFILHLKERGYTSASIARKIAVWKTFFRFLTERRSVVADPTVTLGSPRVDKRAPQVLSADEIARLMDAPTKNNTLKGLRDGAILELLYASGVRVSELTMLDVEDVDLPTQTLRVGRAGKQRTLPLPARTIEIVARYLQRGRPELVRADERALFVNPHGERLTRQGLWLIIKGYVRAAGITTPVTPHTLRHSFAARMLSEGAALSAVQRLLGHANLSTTQKYARLTNDAERND